MDGVILLQSPIAYKLSIWTGNVEAESFLSGGW
jgi:hypothetical protein